MKYLFVSVILVLSLAVCTAEEADQNPSSAVLTVEVVNGTADGGPVTGDQVKVTIYNMNSVIKVLEGKADSDVKAVFEDVPTGRGLHARANVRHKDMSFSGHPIELKPGIWAVTANVEVYEVSMDASQITTGVHHFVINAEADHIRVTEFMQLNNGTDMAISSDRKDQNGKTIVVKVLLPDGFYGLSPSRYFQEDALVLTADGFYDTMAIPPGQYQAVFSYSLPIDAETVAITKKMSMPTAEVMIFSQLIPGRVQGLGESAGQMTLGDGSKAEYFNLSKLKAGDEVTFKITGFNVSRSGDNTVTILIVVFAVLAVLVVIRLVRGTKPS